MPKFKRAPYGAAHLEHWLKNIWSQVEPVFNEMISQVSDSLNAARHTTYSRVAIRMAQGREEKEFGDGTVKSKHVAIARLRLRGLIALEGVVWSVQVDVTTKCFDHVRVPDQVAPAKVELDIRHTPEAQLRQNPPTHFVTKSVETWEDLPALFRTIPDYWP